MFNPEVGGSYAEFLSHLFADSRKQNSQIQLKQTKEPQSFRKVALYDERRIKTVGKVDGLDLLRVNIRGKTI